MSNDGHRRTRAACLQRQLDPRMAALVLASALWMLGLVFATQATAKEPITPEDVTGPVTWGSAERVTHLRHLYFADQPDAKGFEAAKQAGVVTVIDLRAPSERDWDERAVVEELGLTYYNVPVTGDAFDPEAFERIEALVEQHHGEPILLHCSSSNRVGGWLATHLVTRHGLSEEQALAVGRKAGITKDVIASRVSAYLAARAKE